MRITQSEDVHRLRHPNGPPAEQTILTNAEIRGLCDALRTGPGSSGLEADLHALAEWALRARVDHELLEMVLEGELLVQRVGKDDWAFQMTPVATMQYGTAEEGHH